MNERECVCVYACIKIDRATARVLRVMEAAKSRRKRETERERESRRGIKKTKEEETRQLCS